MAKYTAKDIVSCEAPDDLYDSLIVKCIEKDFGLSKKSQTPQITTKWEVVGIKNKENGVDRELVRGDRKYIIAGLSIMPVYFTLSQKAMRFYRDFWCKATGNPENMFEVDDESPDLEYLKGLAMSAVVRCNIVEKTKPLSDEQREQLQAAGLPVKGETVVDDDGNPVTSRFLTIDTWNRRFTGELPVF